MSGGDLWNVKKERVESRRMTFQLDDHRLFFFSFVVVLDDLEPSLVKMGVRIYVF